ncbi:helix-turn-helix domain-containing protein [Actinomadura sp. PM05-2]|uniref:Helix-turn-helix domain-containing protein n=2 Tax=Actinomadura parmotrematis TaxID=2864039 RepID=A0ABS7FL91_9ACTN|nr:helix-turn-helix domain-containing protein [Actinomadura parmotrematis]
MREGAGLTQEAAARRLERSASSLSLIENGVQSLRLRDLSHILDVYKADPSLRDRLLAIADQELQRGWWDGFKGLISADAIDYASVEFSASRIDAVDGMIPGLLQTEDYVRAINVAAEPTADTKAIDHFVSFRMARQIILQRPYPTYLHVAVDEAAFRRVLGSRRVMRAQLVKILNECERENVTVNVLPLDRVPNPFYGSAFQNIQVGRPPLFTLTMIDRFSDRWVLDDEVQVTQHQARVEGVQRAALSKTGSCELIRRILSDL